MHTYGMKAEGRILEVERFNKGKGEGEKGLDQPKLTMYEKNIRKSIFDKLIKR